MPKDVKISNPYDIKRPLESNQETNTHEGSKKRTRFLAVESTKQLQVEQKSQEMKPPPHIEDTIHEIRADPLRDVITSYQGPKAESLRKHLKKIIDHEDDQYQAIKSFLVAKDILFSQNLISDTIV